MDSLASVPHDGSNSAGKTQTGKPQKPGKISPARLEANRRNALKSTGPKTPEGKAIARRNALKHGLSGAGIVVHPLDEERLKVRLDDWTRDLDPEDSVEAWLVGRASLASVRLDRCAIQEQAKLAGRIEVTTNTWMKREEQTAADYAKGLQAKPEETFRTLSGRAVGCEWLMEAWDQLAESLQAKGHLSLPELYGALRLLGQANPPKATSPASIATL
ncbi:MAG TPA: hypothetical protein VGZ22_27085 [Isosphaeraceae bacterium]|jgi:hypothetical protein|nr:hypothetical protein [Isosphaeraceae bacterium]